MVIKGDSKVICFQDNSVKERDLKSIYIPSNYSDITNCLVKIGDTIYYCKGNSLHFMTNELIGTYLAKRLGLDTVDYQIGIRESDGHFFALSEIFYEEGYQYQSACEFLKQHHYKNCFQMLPGDIRTILPSYYRMKTLKLYKGTPFYDSNLKLIALDLKMIQRDRHDENLQVKIDSKGTIDLAPIYDYGRSYKYPFKVAYANPFAFIRFTESTLEHLFKHYPELKEYVFFLSSISIDEILSSIEEEKSVVFTPEERIEYQIAQELSENVINKAKVKTFY